MRKIVIAIATLAMMASVTDGQEIVERYDLLVHATSGEKIFGSLPGSCIRGPLVFWNVKGVEILRLEAGAEIGSGCSSLRLDPR